MIALCKIHGWFLEQTLLKGCFFKVPRHILETILFLVNPYYTVEQGIFKGMNFCGFIHINLFFNVHAKIFCGFGMYVQRKEIL